MKLDLSVRLILFISYSFINKIDQLMDEFSLFIYLFILFSYFLGLSFLSLLIFSDFLSPLKYILYLFSWKSSRILNGNVKWNKKS